MRFFSSLRPQRPAIRHPFVVLAVLMVLLLLSFGVEPAGGWLRVAAGGFFLPLPHPPGGEPAEPRGTEGPVPTFDVVIRDALVADGTGEPAFHGDIGVIGERIAFVGTLEGFDAPVVVDARGLVAAPGFINPHSHVEGILPEDPNLLPSLTQGITTEIVGMDGEGPAEMAAFFRHWEEQGLPLNLAAFVGHGRVRQAVLGGAARAPSPAELERMKELVRRAMQAGALGLSTGLEYVPGKYAGTAEIIALARETAPFGGVYTSHIRNEREQVLGAINEALRIGREAGVPVNISHIKVGRSSGNRPADPFYVGLARQADARIQEAWEGGQEVLADLYPYRAPWYNSRRPLAQALDLYPAEIFLVSRSRPEWEGRSMTDLARWWGITPAAAARRVLQAEPGTRVAVLKIPEAVQDLFAAAPYSVFSVDAPAFAAGQGGRFAGPVHPRGYGTFPKVFRVYVREKGLLGLEGAVHKITGKTASFYGLEDRGVLREGAYADIVLFEPDRLTDHATYGHPDRLSAGIRGVMINGTWVLKEGRPVLDEKGQTPRAGRVLRRAPR